MDEPEQTDLVFQALASRPRRRILDLIKQQPGCCVNDVCEIFEISRIGVMKHLQILVDAQLIISQKQGRTRELFFNSAPIQMIYDRWTDEYSSFWATQAVDLKYRIETEIALSQGAPSKQPQPTDATRDVPSSTPKSPPRKKPAKKTGKRQSSSKSNSKNDGRTKKQKKKPAKRKSKSKGKR